MSTIVRTTTIYGQVVIEINLRCSKCFNLIEWKEGNYGLNIIIVNPCLCLNPVNDDDPILNKNIYDLDWETDVGCVRIINCLKAENIITVKDVLQTSRCYLRKLSNFGRKSLDGLENELKKIGFKLNEGSYSDTINTKHEIKRV